MSDILPNDVWILVFQQNVLTERDLAAVALVSRAFYSLTHEKTLWEIRFRRRWRDLEPFPVSSAEESSLDWLGAFRERYVIDKEIDAVVKRVSQMFTHTQFMEVSDSVYEMLLRDDRTEMFYAFALHYCRHRFATSQPHEDLTFKFYATGLMYFLNKRRIALSLGPVNNLSIEKAVFLLASWLQPEQRLDFDDDWDRLIREMAAQVKAYLRPKHTALPLHWFENTGNASEVPSYLIPTVLDALNDVLNATGFKGNTAGYYSLENSLLNKVLEEKTGIPITLCILYASIAGRLGIDLQLVNFPGHVVLRASYAESKDTETEVEQYIDAFGGGERFTKKDLHSSMERRLSLPRYDPGFYTCVTDFRPVLMRMLNNFSDLYGRRVEKSKRFLVRSFELALCLGLDSVMKEQLLVPLGRAYLSLEYNYAEIVKLMTMAERYHPEIAQEYQHYKEMACNDEKRYATLTAGSNRPEVRQRQEERFTKKNVKHATGMVMQHRKYHYKCVIRGWDPKCEATKSWQTTMGVQTLERQNRQPFYHVLAHDGSERYAAEDNLLIPNDRSPVDHPEVGRYFDSYSTEGFYVMNESMREVYPDDEALVRSLLAYHNEHAMS